MADFDAVRMAEVLGWSLIDSLWQFGLLWICYIILTNNGLRYSSTLRYYLSLLGCVLGTGLFLFGMAGNALAGRNGEYPLSLAFRMKNTLSETLDGGQEFGRLFPVLSILYLGIALWLLARLVWSYQRSRRQLTSKLQPAGGELLEAFQRLLPSILSADSATLWISESFRSPLTIGHFRPLVLFPIAALTRLTPLQLEAVIAHELYHIRHKDYLVNMVLSLVEVLLFFNPFAILLAHQVRKEMENRCDDAVIARGYDRWDYSEALYLLGNEHPDKHVLMLAAAAEGKKFLLQRIRRVNRVPAGREPLIRPLILLLAVLLGTGLFSWLGGSSRSVPDPSGNTPQSFPDSESLAARAEREALKPAPPERKDGLAFGFSNPPESKKKKPVTGKQSDEKTSAETRVMGPEKTNQGLAVTQPRDGMLPESLAPFAPENGVAATSGDSSGDADQPEIPVHQVSARKKEGAFTYRIAPERKPDPSVIGFPKPYIQKPAFYVPSHLDKPGPRSVRL